MKKIFFICCILFLGIFSPRVSAKVVPGDIPDTYTSSGLYNDWAFHNTDLCNDPERYRTEYGDWVATMTTQPAHANDATQQQRNYYAKYREIRFPYPIARESNFSAKITIYGYQTYYDDRVNRSENDYAKANIAPATVKLYTVEDGWTDYMHIDLKGYHCLLPGAPFYKPYTVVLDSDAWPSRYAGKHILGVAVMMESTANNPIVKPHQSQLVAACDCLQVELQNSVNPGLLWSDVLNSPYIKPNPNKPSHTDHWFRGLQDIYVRSCWNANAYYDESGIMQFNNNYGYNLAETTVNLRTGCNSTDTHNSNQALTLDLDLERNSLDYYLGNKFNVLDTVVQAGNLQQAQMSYKFNTWVEGDYTVMLQATNFKQIYDSLNQGTHVRTLHHYNLPDKSSSKLLPTDNNIRVDCTAPTATISSMYESDSSAIVLVNGIKDLRNDKSDGSGFDYARIALCPKNQLSSAPLDELFTDPIHESQPSKLPDTSVEYPSRYKNQFGSWVVIVRLFDHVGNYRDLYTPILRASPAPKNPYLDLRTWHYAEPSTKNRWINTSGDVATVYTSIQSSPEFSKVSAPSGISLEAVATPNSPLKSRSFWEVGSKGNRTSISGTKGLTIQSYPKLVQDTQNGLSYAYAIWHISGLPVCHKNVYDFTTTGYTEYNNLVYKCVTSAKEKDGEQLCLDGVSPIYSYKKVGRHIFELNVTDNDSGIDKILLKDLNGTILYTFTNPTNKTKQTTFSRRLDSLVNNEHHDELILEAIDNVGNKTIATLKDLDTPTDTSILVDGEDPMKVAALDCNGVLHDNRRMLEVKASGKIKEGHSIPRDFTPVWRLNGDGAEVQFNPAQPIMVEQPHSLDTTQYVDDHYNSPTGPSNFKYDRTTTSSKLKWDSLADPTRSYWFSITSKLFVDEEFQTELTTKDRCKIDFASGYDHYAIKVYRVSGNGVLPSSSSAQLIDNPHLDSTELSMDYYRSGWMYATILMYDFNGNPSGISSLWFYHDQPANFSPFDIYVGAVKDVDWEGVPYPIHFGETHNDTSDYTTDGEHVGLFPLGKNSFADHLTITQDKTKGEPIAQGYAVKYRIVKENRDELSSLEVRYQFLGEHGETLTLYQEGKTLSLVDSQEGTTFTLETLSPDKLSTLNDKEPVYISHFLPVNFTAKIASSKKDYVGDVTIRLSFVPTTVDTSSNTPVQGNPQSVDLYTVKMTETAMDDLRSDKQR